MTATKDTICTKCGKPVDKSGSMTQWIFKSSKCSCAEEDTQRELRLCPLCGLRIKGREGTMTGWIFRSNSCNCLSMDGLAEQFETSNLPDNDLIAEDPYEWLAVAGEGGMGIVYKAKDRKLDRLVAVKVMQGGKFDARTYETFSREAKAASKLQHPNIVTIADFGMMKDGRQYMAIEWIDGITLAQYLERHGPLSVDAAREIFLQVLDGLSHAHNRSVVHRDIKPNNIMLGRTASGGWLVKVIDFGTAKEITQDGFQTRVEDMECSPFYVSPERVNGFITDHRADLYSLGCTIFQALTGTPPFTGEALPVVMKHVGEPPPTLSEAADGKEFPSYIEDIVAKLLAKSPDDRFRNAEEAKSALENQRMLDLELERASSDGKLVSIGPKEPNLELSKAGWAALIGSILLIGTIALVFASVLNQKENDRDVKPEFTSTSTDTVSRLEVDSANHKVIATAPRARDFSAMCQLKGVNDLTIVNCKKIPRDAFLNFQSANDLRVINLDSCSMPGNSIIDLVNFPNIDAIRCNQCDINESLAGVLNKKNSRMSVLEMKYCNFGPGAIKVFDSHSIKYLSLDGSGITDETFKDLSKMEELDRIDLSHNDMTGVGFRDLGCKRTLRNLCVHDCQHLTEEGLSMLKDFPALVNLEINETHVTADKIRAIQKIPNLTNLSMPDARVDNDVYPLIGQMHKLKGVSLTNVGTTNEQLMCFKNLKNLEFLRLQNAKATLDGLNNLRKHCKKLGTVLGPWGDR